MGRFVRWGRATSVDNIHEKRKKNMKIKDFEKDQGFEVKFEGLARCLEDVD